MKSNIRLVEEVNKLISNILSHDGGVTLPSVGSLVVVDGEGDSPRTLAFSSDESYKSVVSVIAKRGNCTEDQAAKLYEKWLGEVREGEKLTIANIGIVVGGVVTLTEKMEEKLNPVAKAKKKRKEQEVEQEEVVEQEQEQTVVEETTPVEQEEVVSAEPAEPAKPAKSRAWMVVVAVIAVAALIFTICSGGDDAEECIAECAVVEEVVPEVVAEAAPVVAEVAVSEEVEASMSRLTTNARFVKYPVASAHLAKTISESSAAGRFRVVCGVLKYRGNAGRLILDIENLTEGSNVVCRAYNYSDHYMITVFESNSLSACYNFLRSSEGKLYDSMWVYDSRR